MLTEDGIKSQLDNATPSASGYQAALDEPPLRMELFSPDQRRERGRDLGQEHHTGKERAGAERLLVRLRENEEVIRAVHHRFVDDVSQKIPVISMGEWLMDNFYVIEEQISLAKRHLPKKYLMELPRLANPGKAGLPRVYDLAEHIIAYGDSRITPADLFVIISAYQETIPLNIGELWAVPIMLRLAIIENIRRMAVLARLARDQRELARRWCEELVRVNEQNPKNLVITIADMARANLELSRPFVSEFKRQLQGRGSAMKLPLQWLEQNLNEQERTLDQVVADENHEQATFEISMRNCITSLRALGVTDWNEFVESMSRVEQILRKDPADVYGKMDFASRDDYRRIVEKLARRGQKGEVEVAAECLALARDAAITREAGNPRAHVGYYLVGRGSAALRKALGCRPALSDLLHNQKPRLTLGLYFGSVLLFTALFTFLTTLLARAGGVGYERPVILFILVVIVTLHLAVGLVDYLATQLIKPRRIPRLDFSKGIPAEHRTLVAVPTLLVSEEGVDEILRILEMHYLGNPGANIHFSLLTDFSDASSETTPSDEKLLNLCSLGVMKLNDKYPGHSGDSFFLFHRPRKWNPREKCWMGWERKRGKLEDLNRYLLGSDPEVFSRVVGRTHTLSNVRYVITLDTDTAMGRDSARQMVGAMAHPLNSPRYSEQLGRVVSGHGILQPRVDSNLAGANRSLYARMTAGDIGIDPYTRASSDLYQDLFDEGSFIGKGVYDVGTFDHALGGRFPDNKILSHDLLEGCVVRSGLLGDVKFYEDPPRTYLMDIQRRHRWIRGDWQIAGYLIGGETRRNNVLNGNPLSFLSRWKIFDNLRRSLTPVAAVLLLILALTISINPVLLQLVAFLAFLGPVAVAGFFGLFKVAPDKTVRQHLKNSLAATGKQALQVLFKFSCLPFEACVNLDAIGRSLWRQCVSKEKLLEWRTSHESSKQPLDHFGVILRTMWIAPVLGVVVGFMVYRANPHLALYALPLFLLWLLSPVFAYILSRPRRRKVETLSDAERVFLRRNARRIWNFFETFVGPSDNWLPPDNYQEQPLGRIAHRTSPTNIGLSLLANLSAYDFGFITANRLLERTGHTLATMSRMDRFRGHFYNWYDTRTLAILRPAYISSVDSGNLAAHLLVLASGLREVAEAEIILPQFYSGLRDSIELAVSDAGRPELPIVTALEQLRGKLGEAAKQPPRAPWEIRRLLGDLSVLAWKLISEWEKAHPNEGKIRKWLEYFRDQCLEATRELDEIAPWAEALIDKPEWRVHPELGRLPSYMEAVSLSVRLQAARMDDSAETPGAPPPAAAANGAAANADGTPEPAGNADSAMENKHLPIHPDLVLLLQKGAEHASSRLADLQQAVIILEDFANLDFEFLYDKAKRLLSIGFNVDERRLDQSYYDLLASEARLAAYLGVAQHKLPQESWFAMGRLLTVTGRRPLLISWSGSMFEYLMPMLVMHSYEGTLLDENCKAAVLAQIDYAAEKKVPWGISESGFNLLDADQNYQYRAFGVPQLGLKHFIDQDLVIAPYACILAAMVFPQQAAQNLRRMMHEGWLTPYGYFEAVDFTPGRTTRAAGPAVVHSYMAHHQGMSLVAIGQVLLGRPMHRRFLANPHLASTTLLLQEIAPTEKARYFHSTYSPAIRQQPSGPESPIRVISNPSTPHPDVQLLSNGCYQVMITAAGGGYSRWNEFALTRWREDSTRDNWGTYCYLRDKESGDTWSATHQPTRAPYESQEAVFAEGKAEFNRRDKDFTCHTEIVVTPEDDVEVRRLRLTNRSGRKRHLDITTFAEVALNLPAADDSHPAFSKLFVETRLVPGRQAIVCSRRPRSDEEYTPFLFHMLAVRGTVGGTVSYETDRLAFIGRNNDPSRPAALLPGCDRLGNSAGAVLDPVLAIRSDLFLESGEAVVVDIVTGISRDQPDTDRLLEKYQDERSTDRAFDLAWTHGQLLLRQQGISDAEARQYAQLAGSVVYANPSMRADAGTLIRNRLGQSGLWGYAISGDLPIVLVKISDSSNLGLIRQIVQAHTYWKLKGLKADLVIWNEDQSGYRQNLNDEIVGLAGLAMNDANLEKPGGIFIRSTERIPEEDRVLIQSAARVVLSDADGMLPEQLRKLARAELALSNTVYQFLPQGEDPREEQLPPVEKLVLANGYGGFAPDGREYVVVTGKGVSTPLPWVNVIANPEFGCVVSESGSTHTWAVNAHEFRLTPWSNDPVSDPTGEALYIRDEQTGEYWSPTPHPCRPGGAYIVRHGFGYSRFDHRENGIESRLTIHVDRNAPVKFFTLRLVNHSGKRRNLSVTGYVEWVLGDLRGKTGMHIVTGVDSRSGALVARNPYSGDFKSRLAFLDVDDPGRGVSGDRRDFIGRNRDLANPAAMSRYALSGRVGPGLDACGAARLQCNLGPGQDRELVFRLGSANDIDSARRLIKEFRGQDAARASLRQVTDYWRETLGAIQVDTPDTAFNFMANGWALYQTLSCRFWGREATYQSGGAFGFRDQLQDSMALVYAEPALARKHLLDSAERQFEEGDVQHWWHPPVGRGVRTRCSDDYLWLPYVTAHYTGVTGDVKVLDEKRPYLLGRPLREDEESYYDLPQASGDRASLYEHCKKAIEHGLRFGEHGLPLMGSGDWNDGMDLVGGGDKGESVWLGFFLHSVLNRFSGLAEARGDRGFADRCRHEAALLAANLEKHAWDGAWYRRAYFDDGTPLGSDLNEECRIDSIAQSWAVLSGVAAPVRAAEAMRSLEGLLVDRENRLIRLFTPPFDKSPLNPGYIKGYVPGVRENGGQYTHGAIWAAMASAKLGDHRTAWELQEILNPINHSRDRAWANKYMNEPYAISADIYTNPQYPGRGGWSWYTGSASWFYRFMLENILGFSMEGNVMKITPCAPKGWTTFGIRVRKGGAHYDITVKRAEAGRTAPEIKLDGVETPGLEIPLSTDHHEHRVEVSLAF